MTYRNEAHTQAEIDVDGDFVSKEVHKGIGDSPYVVVVNPLLAVLVIERAVSSKPIQQVDGSPIIAVVHAEIIGRRVLIGTDVLEGVERLPIIRSEVVSPHSVFRVFPFTRIPNPVDVLVFDITHVGSGQVWVALSVPNLVGLNSHRYLLDFRNFVIDIADADFRPVVVGRIQNGGMFPMKVGSIHPHSTKSRSETRESFPSPIQQSPQKNAVLSAQCVHKFNGHSYHLGIDTECLFPHGIGLAHHSVSSVSIRLNGGVTKHSGIGRAVHLRPMRVPVVPRSIGFLKTLLRYSRVVSLVQRNDIIGNNRNEVARSVIVKILGLINAPIVMNRESTEQVHLEQITTDIHDAPKSIKVIFPIGHTHVVHDIINTTEPARNSSPVLYIRGIRNNTALLGIVGLIKVNKRDVTYSIIVVTAIRNSVTRHIVGGLPKRGGHHLHTQSPTHPVHDYFRAYGKLRTRYKQATFLDKGTGIPITHNSKLAYSRGSVSLLEVIKRYTRLIQSLHELRLNDKAVKVGNSPVFPIPRGNDMPQDRGFVNRHVGTPNRGSHVPADRQSKIKSVQTRGFVVRVITAEPIGNIYGLSRHDNFNRRIFNDIFHVSVHAQNFCGQLRKSH